MTAIIFIASMVMHALASIYYVRRFFSMRRPISLVISGLCFGWVLAFAREMHLMPRWLAAYWMYVGAVLGLLHLMAIQKVESQQPGTRWPFRWRS